MNKKTYIWIIIFIVVVAAIVVFFATRGGVKSQLQSSQPINVSFSCNAGKPGKTIQRNFLSGTSTPVVDSWPTADSDRSVSLTLAGGRHMICRKPFRLMARDMANADESVIFGTSATRRHLDRNNGQQTFSGCVSVVSDPGGLPQAYASSTAGFSYSTSCRLYH